MIAGRRRLRCVEDGGVVVLKERLVGCTLTSLGDVGRTRQP
jgi:hypothetical protein